MKYPTAVATVLIMCGCGWWISNWEQFQRSHFIRFIRNRSRITRNAAPMGVTHM